ncbi:MAG: hypothetical protein AAGK23_09765, partial [Pseudomonadota bacterium]
MDRFSISEIEEIDRYWRARSDEDAWSGWAAAGWNPKTIWIYRTREHWRRFPLIKHLGSYALLDDNDREVSRDASLSHVLSQIDAVPGLTPDRS